MTRPTVTVETGVTSGSTLTIPANTKGIWVACHREGSHAMTGVAIGGVALTLDNAGGETNAEVGHDLHICTFSIDDYAAFNARADDVITFTGGTIGATLDDDLYRAEVFYVQHSTHTVELAAVIDGSPETVQTQPLFVTVNPGLGVDARAILAATNGALNYTTPLASGTILYGPAAIDNDGAGTWIYANHAAITGSTAVGTNSGAGSNPRGALAASAWIEGDSLLVTIAYDAPIAVEVQFQAGYSMEAASDVVIHYPTPMVAEVIIQSGYRMLAEGPYEVMLAPLDLPHETTSTTEGKRGNGDPAEDGDHLAWHPDRKPTWEPETGGSATIEVAEEDGSPDLSGIGRLEFDGATVTNPSAGVALVTISGGGGPHTHDAEDVTYDNSGSGLAATDVQAAIDEVAGASGGSTPPALRVYLYQTFR